MPHSEQELLQKLYIKPYYLYFNILPTATCPLNQFWWAKDVLDIQYPVNHYNHFARLVRFQNLSFCTACKDNAPSYVVPYLSLPRTCWTAGEWEPTPPAGWGTSHHSSQPCSGSWSPGTWQGTPASAPRVRTSSLRAVTALHWGKSRRGKQLSWVAFFCSEAGIQVRATTMLICTPEKDMLILQIVRFYPQNHFSELKGTTLWCSFSCGLTEHSRACYVPQSFSCPKITQQCPIPQIKVDPGETLQLSVQSSS